MKFKTLSVLAVGGTLLVSGIPLLAHHSFAAEYDSTKPITLKGAVTKIEWINPHSWLYLDVNDAKTGQPVHWKIEMGAPNQLIRKGWNKASMPAGTEVIVEGYRAKNGTPSATGRTVKFADGRNFFMGSTGAGAPEDGYGEK